MWPPRRSPIRIASSRLTCEPCSSSPSADRRSVSSITSAPKRGPHRPTAVRQTPLTATESPSDSSEASFDSKVRRAPSSERSTVATMPRSSTRPVNTSPLLQAGRDQQVVLDLLAVERDRPQRVGDVLDALALERIARLPAAEDHRREEQPHLVDLAGVEERAGQVRPAPGRRGGNAHLAEPVERVAPPRRLVLARRHHDLRARALERLERGPRR